MSKHYDVVVLGAGIGALATAALLARRSWRVLVLGHGYKPPQYSYGGLPLARRPFTWLAGSSPAWARVLVELAQSQAFRRHVRSLDPMLEIMAPRVRLSIPPDSDLFAREVDRELGEVRRVVDELYAELARVGEVADDAFSRDVVWPPGTFWERRETARVAALLPYTRDLTDDILAEFPEGHLYRDVVQVPTSFASDLAAPLPVFAIARLHGAWTRGVGELSRGEVELTEFLVDRILAHGGEVKLASRASHVSTKSGRILGVNVDGDSETTGVQFVVTDAASAALLDLASEFRPSRRLLDSRTRVLARAERFVVSVLVHDEGLPAPLATESFLMPPRGTSCPVVHLHRWASPSPAAGTTLLVAEALVGPDHPFGGEDLRAMRAAVLSAIEALLPYIERHYVLVDSPHDGLPLWDYRSGVRQDVERTELRSTGGSLDAEPMTPLYALEPPETPFGVARLWGEPIRFPIGNAFGVGGSILPALGQEGELLAAWGAARAITRTDRRKEKMRREMWSKVELT
jgi:glycine/D-amino acid oxidase-like deaminating enzyme